MDTIQELIVKYDTSKSKDCNHELIERLKTEDTLYIAFSPATKNYYVDIVKGQAVANVFSQKKYYEEYHKYISNQEQ